MTLLKKLYDMALKERIQDFDKYLKDKLNRLKDYLTDAAKEAGEAAENLYEDFLEWIQSYDPVRHFQQLVTVDCKILVCQMQMRNLMS